MSQELEKSKPIGNADTTLSTAIHSEWANVLEQEKSKIEQALWDQIQENNELQAYVQHLQTTEPDDDWMNKLIEEKNQLLDYVEETVQE